MKLAITSYCRIKNNSVTYNGTELILPVQTSATNNFTELYKKFEINYPKFHKMDNISKLGIIATELAINNSGFLERNTNENVAIILANNASSLDTDRIHQQSISDSEKYLPSPATFVYTLPNIIIGELAIRHKLTGESVFFVNEAFDSNLLISQAELLIGNQNTTAAICGWVDYDNGISDALIYLVEIVSDSIKNTNFTSLNTETLNRFYK